MTVNKPKLVFVVKLVAKTIGLLACLYFFICSLELMSSSFRLIGGRFIGKANRLNTILENKLAGLMVGILITIFVQSSSTSTSIVVAMVSAEIIQVKSAVPVIMGSNIGTSITSTLVSLSQINNCENFQRAFSGAVVHDIFNFLTVAVLLPIEIVFGLLELITDKLVSPLLKYNNSGYDIELLNKLTKPLTNLIIQIDNSVIESLASGNELNENQTLIKHWCKFNENSNKLNPHMIRCKFLFESINWPEWSIGLVLLLFSLILLCCCLVVLVKLLNSIFFGKIAKLLQKLINSNCPGFLKHFTGYFAILIGAFLTVIIQSSSAFTSTLTPLVGIGLVSIERVFPLILGSNIGTTITGILAALSSPSKTLKYSLQIALCHSFFNIFGIFIWYPIPFMRNVPIKTAKWLGKKTFKYRWFSIFYIMTIFFIIPSFLLLLSFAGMIVFLCFVIPILLLLILILIVNLIQNKQPHLLPVKFRNWNFLPIYLRSLKPYDRFVKKYCVCYGCLLKEDLKKINNLSKVTTIQDSVINIQKSFDIYVLHHSNLYKLDKLQDYQFSSYFKTVN